jgi:DNA-binding NtrC family response regulator
MRVLLAEDDKGIRVTLGDAIKEKGYDLTIAPDGNRALELLSQQEFDCALLDIKLPGVDGMTILQKTSVTRPDLPIIIITGFGTVDSAIVALKSGAYDYLEKPFYNEKVLLILERIRQQNKIRQEYLKLKEEKQHYEDLVGKSHKMKEVFQLIESVAKSDASVLIQGESGTGKELVAEAIHTQSLRKDAPLIKISCAVFPENLIEAELFGHEKGAFTDAKAQKIGRFEMGDKGTIFLDDIDDMSPRTQVKLLRVLQEHEFERIGGTATIKVDIRILVATKDDLQKKVKDGSFREDLYYRLNVVNIKIPPLRERESDIQLLMDHFIKKYGKDKEYKVESETLFSLQNYNWPGNVRELENSVERAVTLAGDSLVLKKEHLIKSQPVQSAPLDSSQLPDQFISLVEYLNQAEVVYLKRLNEFTKGNKTEMAGILQISRKNLWEKLKKYGLE